MSLCFYVSSSFFTQESPQKFKSPFKTHIADCYIPPVVNVDVRHVTKYNRVLTTRLFQLDLSSVTEVNDCNIHEDPSS